MKEQALKWYQTYFVVFKLDGRMSWTGPSNMVELFNGSPFLMCLTIF